jgi:hypothetical protein
VSSSSTSGGAATFRRQCSRIIDTPNVLVRRAGRLEADIYIVRQNMFVELLAHELEHVIEQLEGLDLQLAARQGRGRVREGAYETRRAIEAGRKVAAEVKSTW